MTYCICKKCGKDILLDNWKVELRGGYLCDECYEQLNPQRNAKERAGTCNPCKAFSPSGSSMPICKLGFEIDAKTCSPKEDCPRPLTYLDFIELRGESKN